jgi:hypothetical protein
MKVFGPSNTKKLPFVSLNLVSKFVLNVAKAKSVAVKPVCGVFDGDNVPLGAFGDALKVFSKSTFDIDSFFKKVFVSTGIGILD